MNIPNMISKGQSPLKTFKVNDSYILSVYQGNISKYDLLMKYRQKDKKTKTGWRRIRTPKHIHWAVDILLKLNTEQATTKNFISFLMNYWDINISPIKSIKERDFILSDNLLKEVEKESLQYPKLANKGDYSVKFLLLIAKLLMYQEKINLETVYMFRNLLKALQDNENIYKIIYTATHK
jgi:hypothetical protein